MQGCFQLGAPAGVGGVGGGGGGGAGKNRKLRAPLLLIHLESNISTSVDPQYYLDPCFYFDLQMETTPHVVTVVTTILEVNTE